MSALDIPWGREVFLLDGTKWYVQKGWHGVGDAYLGVFGYDPEGQLIERVVYVSDIDIQKTYTRRHE